MVNCLKGKIKVTFMVIEEFEKLLKEAIESRSVDKGHSYL